MKSTICVESPQPQFADNLEKRWDSVARYPAAATRTSAGTTSTLLGGYSNTTIRMERSLYAVNTMIRLMLKHTQKSSYANLNTEEQSS